MQKVLSSLALLICICAGISANILKNYLNFEQNKDSAQIKIQESDNFPVPPYCGFGKEPKISTGRIYGGVKVEQHEFPWMVYLPMGCGGTLINSRWVLTAAHCFYMRDADVAYLNGKECSRGHCDSTATVVQISKKIIHENYDHHQGYNDIALIQFKDAVTFSETIQPICLPIDNQGAGSKIFNKNAIVSGWGFTELNKTSNYLLKTTVEIWEADKCEAFRDIDHFVMKSELQICAGGIAGIDACGGDSGGPLFMRLPTSDKNDGSKPFYQFGIVSFGKECGKHGYPGVYVNVTNYIPWIRNTITTYE